MSTKLGNVVADLDLQLATKTTVGGTTATLKSILDDDSVALPDGQYVFTLDGTSSAKEHILCTLTASTKVISNVQSVSRQGVLTTGFARVHKVGAVCEQTDFGTLFFLAQLLKGVDSLDADNPLKYDSSPSLTLGTQLATKDYADALSIAGAPVASTTVMGVVRLASVPSVTLGAATITIASPAVISKTAHGLTVNDAVKFTTAGTLPTSIVAGTQYFVIAAGLTTDAFEISATLGGSAINTSGSQSGTQTLYKTTPVVVLDTDTRLLTAAQILALAGTSGTPSGTNEFVTENDTTNLAAQTSTTISFTASTKTIADSGSGFVSSNFRAGASIIVSGTASNNGTYTIISVIAGAIVVAETLVDEGAGASMTLTAVKANKVLRLSAAGTLPSTGGLGIISLFGNGSDGDVTISTNTNLTRDMYYNNLTINTGITLNPSGYRIFVKNTLTTNGTGKIARNGNNGGNGGTASAGYQATGGTAGTAGAALAGGSIAGGVAGTAGSVGGASGAGGGSGGSPSAPTTTTNPSSLANALGVAGANGVAGGTGGSSSNGGAAGTGGAVTPPNVVPILPIYAVGLHTFTDTAIAWMKTSNAGGGAGAGGGGFGYFSNDSGGGAGGGSGGGGGVGGIVAIYASIIINNGTISANGGTGGNGGAGGAGSHGTFYSFGGGGGSGGNGGNGGVVVLVYNSLTNNGTISVTGSAAGTAGAGGAAPSGGGGAGTAGSSGTAGSDGVIYSIAI